MPRPLCLFHKNCLDGSGAAAVVARRFPNMEFLPVQYGAPPPTVEGRDVYLVDFGYSLEGMRRLKAQANSLVWIDHHGSQEDIWKSLGWGVFDTRECGSSLTWRTLFPGEPEPPVVAYIRDKDLWQWRLPDSRAVCAGLAETFANSKFQGLLEADLVAMAERGRPILAARQLRIEAAARTGVAIRDAFGIPGMTALAVPTTQDQNELGEHICRPLAEGGLGYDVAVMYYRKSGTTHWVHSLRSREGVIAGGAPVDCGAIAARNGGGGHPTSGCFLSPTPLVPPSLSPANPS